MTHADALARKMGCRAPMFGCDPTVCENLDDSGRFIPGDDEEEQEEEDED